MKYITILSAAILLSACGRDTKHNIIGKWQVRSATFHGMAQKIPPTAFLMFTDKKAIAGEPGKEIDTVTYDLRGDTIVTHIPMTNGQTRNSRLVILKNDGHNLQIDETDIGGMLVLEKVK